MLDAGSVAAVLEGFEGTLDEVIGRVASPELSADLDVMQTRINALGVSIEPEEAELPFTTNNPRLVATLRSVF
jgi:hypothetical protein